MVMNIIAIAALAIIATILCKLMDKYDKIYSLLITLAVTTIVILLVFTYISPIMEMVHNLFTRSGLDYQYVEILFKALGICYVTQFAFDICKDSGENAMATQVELAGKVSLLILALPLFQALIEIVTKLISL